MRIAKCNRAYWRSSHALRDDFARRTPEDAHRKASRAHSAAAWQLTRRAVLALRSATLGVRIVAGTVLLMAVWASVNWMVQVARKPSEVFFPVSGSLGKTPAQTWRQYRPLFAKHSTAVITPELLAALAQVEGSGNPMARTYWRWRLSWNPFEVYRPASSAVGMFQITDGTFAEARRYCIHDHIVVEDGPWHDPRSCWFNTLYTRVVPGHAVEMTAALLDRTVARTLGRNRIATASLQQQQDLAAVIHLCGGGAGDAYARRAFRFRRGQRCGDHDARRYLAEVNAVKLQFARLAASGSSSVVDRRWWYPARPGHCQRRSQRAFHAHGEVAVMRSDGSVSDRVCEATLHEEGLEPRLGSKGVPFRIDHQQCKVDVVSLVGTLQPRVRRISICQPGVHQGCGVWRNVPLA